MSPAKLAACCGAAAISLSACGSTHNPNPVAGSIPPGATRAGHARIDDPRLASNHSNCLRQHHVPFSNFGRAGIQVLTPGGPTIVFTPTPGAAQAQQIQGQAQPAEVVGAALVYPNQAPDGLMSVVETCLSVGVKG